MNKVHYSNSNSPEDCVAEVAGEFYRFTSGDGFVGDRDEVCSLRETAYHERDDVMVFTNNRLRETLVVFSSGFFVLLAGGARVDEGEISV